MPADRDLRHPLIRSVLQLCGYRCFRLMGEIETMSVADLEDQLEDMTRALRTVVDAKREMIGESGAGRAVSNLHRFAELVREGMAPEQAARLAAGRES